MTGQKLECALYPFLYRNKVVANMQAKLAKSYSMRRQQNRKYMPLPTSIYSLYGNSKLKEQDTLKKRLAGFPSQAGMSLTKLSLGGNNLSAFPSPAGMSFTNSR
jgi:hypothetical protein